MPLTESLDPKTNGDFDLRSPGELTDPAIGRLLSLFPNAKPASIPVRVGGLPAGASGGSERSTIVFCGRDFAIFLLNFPLYGVHAVRLRTFSGQRDTTATVVAIMPSAPGFAVVVRFLEDIPKWLLQA